MIDDTTERQYTRHENISTRQAEQRRQATKMIRMNQQAGFRVSVGDAIALFPDPRDRANQSRHGIHCLVFAVSHSLQPSVRLVLPERIIGDKRTRTPTWYARDTYSVIHSSSPMGKARRDLQKQIIDKTFDPTKMAFLSIRDAHRIAYSQEGQLKTKLRTTKSYGTGCSCKAGSSQCTTNNCGCRKKNQACDASCKCSENRCMNRNFHQLPGV